ncbi:MAG: hypothetical protein ACJAZO_005347 [Myxococcota bacterium]
MVDKNWKLQRYSRKDYSEIVDFPVEIVGRDGVVRRYSFEDSIRLYQRRVTFAAIRYRDPDLVGAETHHCQSRIEQLRASFFHRFGWGSSDHDSAGDHVLGNFSGEVAAFFCRVLQCQDRPDVHVVPMDGEDGLRSTWFVRVGAKGPGLLLYFFHLDGPSAEPLREQFFETLKMLERVNDPEVDCERLVAFHHTGDCGMILTARAGEFDALEAVRGEPVIAPDIAPPTPWDEVVEILRTGDQMEAVERCRELVTEQPYHQRAYLAGAVLCLALDAEYEAEDFALIGSRYFPDQGLLHHYLSLARNLQGRTAEALDDARRAVELVPDFAAARSHLVALLLFAHHYREAASVTAVRPARTRERSAELSLDRMGQWIWWRRVMRFGAHTSLLLGLFATLFGGPLGLVPVMMGIAMASLGTWIFNRQLVVLTERSGPEDLAMGLRRIHKIGVQTDNRVD